MGLALHAVEPLRSARVALVADALLNQRADRLAIEADGWHRRATGVEDDVAGAARRRDLPFEARPRPARDGRRGVRASLARAHGIDVDRHVALLRVEGANAVVPQIHAGRAFDVDVMA